MLCFQWWIWNHLKSLSLTIKYYVSYCICKCSLSSSGHSSIPGFPRVLSWMDIGIHQFFFCINWYNYYTISLLKWWFTLADFWMLTLTWLPEINLTWFWYISIILFMLCWIQFTNILLRTVVSVFKRFWSVLE